MVNRIDARARRRVLAEAVWRVIRRDGFEAASVRGVAAEAGLSAGSVRHFFDSQAALRRFAMEDLLRTVADRVAVARAAEHDPMRRALATLAELLPLTDRTREEFSAHLQFVARAAVDEEMAPVARASYDGIQSLCATVVGELHDAGLTRRDLDLAPAASTLGVLVDGLFLRLLTAPHLVSPEGARNELRRHLQALSAPVAAR